VADLPKWGKLLYDTVNAEESRNPLEAWKAAKTDDRRFTVKVNKAVLRTAPEARQGEANEAATLLLSLPWELIHDEKSYLFLGAHPVRVRRSLPAREQQKAVATRPPIRVLLVCPRPEDEHAAYIDHRTSARPLVEALNGLGPLAKLKILDPPTFPALEKEVLRAAEAGNPYHVIHFDGHGVYDRKHGLGMLCFEDPADAGKLEHRRSQLIPADEIARVVRDHRSPLVFLEACQTAKAVTDPGASVAGRLLENGVSSVAAMSHSVLVETARIFITDFYEELLRGKRVGQAMLAGQRKLKSDTFRGKTFNGEVRLHDWFVPVLFQEEQDPVLITEVPAPRTKSTGDKDPRLGALPEEPDHKFLGRGRDLLKAERKLADSRYLVVRGSGGEGKTTFAAELAAWLVATRRFDRATFTSVEQVAEARQVLFSIGDQLVPHFAASAGTDDRHGLKLIQRALGERPTVVVIDNLETILSGELASGALEEILSLCASLGKVGQTRLIFTSREALPAPFDQNVLPMGRLDQADAIRLLGNVLPNAPHSKETEQDIENLVEAVGGHARSLVLIAREVGVAGVRRATQDLLPVLQAIEARYPGQRENSLLASAELSLRRLPAEIRQLIRPLSIFHGGGGLGAIALALKLDQERLLTLVRALIGVGLAEYVEPGYLRFDPALLGVGLDPAERATATTAWARAIAAEIQFLYQQRSQDAILASGLTLLNLPNFLPVLNYLAGIESPEAVVDLATRLESLVAPLNRPKVLARVVEIRQAAARGIHEWSHAQYLAADASINRLISEGRFTEAVQTAENVYLKCSTAGESAYRGAAYDLATVQVTLGRALQMGGDASTALPHLEQAQGRFERLKEFPSAARMAAVALREKADCLRDLGRYDEAADAYLQTIALAEQRNDRRSVAGGEGQLATLHMLQKNYSESLRLLIESRGVFERLNEPASVATAWHQIGLVHQQLGHFEAAEQAYQNSLNIEVQRGSKDSEASSLGQRGSLYAQIGRTEDAVRLYLQAADIAVQLGDLSAEGSYRSNVANFLIRLGRYEEARREIRRAIECKKPFGHAAQLWKTFDILCNLERAVGDQPAALTARRQALDAYLAYRRDGGAPQIETTELLTMVKQDAAAARAVLADTEIPYRVAAEVTLALEELGN
jgi:tetratricopeptide (TPR) repeat protein